MRDREGEVSMVDSCATISLSLSLFHPPFHPRPSFSFSLRPFVHPFPPVLSLSLLPVLTSYALDFTARANILIHSSSVISSPDSRFHANSARLLLFNSRSLTRRQYGFAAIPIIRCTHTTTSSIMAMTAVPPSLFMPTPYRPTPLARVSFVCSPCAASTDLFPAFFLAFPYRSRTSETSECDRAAKYPSEECWVVRSATYDSVRGSKHSGRIEKIVANRMSVENLIYLRDVFEYSRGEC